VLEQKRQRLIDVVQDLARFSGRDGAGSARGLAHDDVEVSAAAAE